MRSEKIVRKSLRHIVVHLITIMTWKREEVLGQVKQRTMMIWVDVVNSFTMFIFIDNYVQSTSIYKNSS